MATSQTAKDTPLLRVTIKPIPFSEGYEMLIAKEGRVQGIQFADKPTDKVILYALKKALEALSNDSGSGEVKDPMPKEQQ